MDLENCSVNLVMEPFIKSFFATREFYTKAGLRGLFDHLLLALDPERSFQRPGRASSQNSDGSYSPPPLEQEVSVPECILEVEVEDGCEAVSDISLDDDYQKNMTVAAEVGFGGNESSFNCSDKDELKIIREIPTSESSLAKTVKEKLSVSLEGLTAAANTFKVAGPPPPSKELSIAGLNLNDKDELKIIQEIPVSESLLAKTVKEKLSVSAGPATGAKPRVAKPPSPKEFSITENLLGGLLEALKQNVESNASVNQSDGRRPSLPTHAKIRDKLGPAKRNQHSPYYRSPQQITYPRLIKNDRVLDPRLFERGLLQRRNGRIHYGISEILQHFGTEEDVKDILPKAYTFTPLTHPQRDCVTRCSVQCLKAAYGYYDRKTVYQERLDQLSLDLEAAFPGIIAERWRITCISALLEK